MPFGLWDQMGLRNHAQDGSPVVLRNVAMATNFGIKITLCCRYKMASDVDTTELLSCATQISQNSIYSFCFLVKKEPHFDYFFAL